MSKELDAIFERIEMSKEAALELLEKIAEKPKEFFFYDLDESYAHEIDKEDEPDKHLGGVVNVAIVRKTYWNNYGSTVYIVVFLENNIILTNDGYLQFHEGPINEISDTSIKVAYDLNDAKFIRDIWDERAKSLNESGI